MAREARAARRISRPTKSQTEIADRDYDRRIDPVLVIAAASLLLIVLGVARVAWRFLHDNEEPQAGGSMGYQLFGRFGRSKKRSE